MLFLFSGRSFFCLGRAHLEDSDEKCQKILSRERGGFYFYFFKGGLLSLV